jgi:hypothetical protein
VSHRRDTGKRTWKRRTTTAKKSLDLNTQTLERGGVVKPRADFIELRDGSGHGGTRALLRADEDD